MGEGIVNRHKRIVGDNSHLECLGALGDLRAYITQADNAQCLVSKLNPDQFASLPFA